MRRVSRCAHNGLKPWRISAATSVAYDQLFLALVYFLAKGLDHRNLPDGALSVLLHLQPGLVTEQNIFAAAEYLDLAPDDVEYVFCMVAMLIADQFRLFRLPIPYYYDESVRSGYYVRGRRVRSAMPVDRRKSLTPREAALEMAAFDRALGLV